MWAYNRWLQEFVAQQPDRLFALGQTAVRSVKEAVKDLEQMKAMGFKGVMLPGFPSTDEDYYDSSYDALWEASVGLQMPICFHTITTTHPKDAVGAFVTAPKQRGKSKLCAFQSVMRGVQDLLALFIFDGIFDRHPKLKVVGVEGDAGWAPHFMYRADHTYGRFRASQKAAALSKTPSEFFKENIYLTFQDDWVALKLVDMMNPQRMMWANDFPHGDATWPNSQALLKSHAAHLSDEQKRWILRENVIDLFNLKVAA
jgi:predicted TIM-barrel fold metal-dependent hydrolase